MLKATLSLIVVAFVALPLLARAGFPCQDGFNYCCDGLNVCECKSSCGGGGGGGSDHPIGIPFPSTEKKVGKIAPAPTAKRPKSYCVCKDAGINENAVGFLRQIMTEEDGQRRLRVLCDALIFDRVEDLAVAASNCQDWVLLSK